MPFREAHGIVGGLVREAVERPASRCASCGPSTSTRRRAALLERSSWLESKDSEGGTASARVRAAARRCARARCVSPGGPSRRHADPTPVAVIDRAFFDRPVLEVAPDLLGCVLRHGDDERA